MVDATETPAAAPAGSTSTPPGAPAAVAPPSDPATPAAAPAVTPPVADPAAAAPAAEETPAAAPALVLNAPEGYGNITIPPDDPTFSRVAEALGRHGGKQELMDDLVKAVFAALPSDADLAKAAESKFGAEAPKVIEANRGWVSALPADVRDAFDQLLYTPGGHAAIKWARELQKGAAPQPGAGAPAASAVTSEEEARALIREPDYWTNPAKQRRVAEYYARTAAPG